MSALPGTVWNYNTGSSHLLSAILQEVTGTTTQAFAQAHLFDPLGISNVAWSADQGGITTGGWGLRLTPRDMAKLGYLYLNDGVWDGEQIVPAAWIQDSVERRFQVPNPLEPWDLYYGYSWWLHQIGPYAAHGRHGQFIYVLPDLDLVVVFTGGLDESEFVQPEVLIRDYVMPAVTVIDSP
jgi:CubicO group peptidase (beta-lactamase class C family)